jgi:hypothetical protein
MTMLRRLAPALLACLAATTSQAASPRAAAKIELVPAADLWEVRYTLPAPARELRFARANGKGHRAATWTPVDAQWEIATEGEEEIVRRRDGKPFDHAAFRMAPRYAVLEKDYAPFSPFGDGGMLVYTGQFHACAGACKGGETHALRLQPPAAAHAIVHGKVVDAVDFVDEADGTNLYIGRATPVDTPDVVAVIDRAFPADTRARLESLLPRLMAFYGSEFGALPSRPNPARAGLHAFLRPPCGLRHAGVRGAGGLVLRPRGGAPLPTLHRPRRRGRQLDPRRRRRCAGGGRAAGAGRGG